MGRPRLQFPVSALIYWTCRACLPGVWLRLEVRVYFQVINGAHWVWAPSECSWALLFSPTLLSSAKRDDLNKLSPIFLCSFLEIS